MKKFCINDNFLKKCKKIIDSASVFFVFFLGCGLGLIAQQGCDKARAVELAGGLIGSSLYFIGLLLFLYLVVNTERIFLLLKGDKTDEA